MATPQKLSGTPRQHGFSFPAEWALQTGTWFSWPRPEGISFPSKYHTVPASLASIIIEIAPRQTVHINVPNENYERIVREQLIANGVAAKFFGAQTPLEGTPSRKCRIQFHYMPTNEAWCRDHGPAIVTRRQRGKREFAIVDWGFNAWGGKYPPFDADDNVPTRIAQEFADQKVKGFAGIFYPRFKGQPIVMEGGSVDFNGKGTILTTDSCLLHQNRNPNMTQRDVERVLKDWYGQSHVVWLGDGIVGDDTDGHIDDISRFVGPRTIVTVIEDDSRDKNHKPLKENLKRLEHARDQDGKPFEIVTIPMPRAVEHEGQRLPASYANFLFINGACLVPTFRDKKTERVALGTLQRLLPDHEVIGIDCTELVWGLGTIHCLTQQVARA